MSSKITEITRSGKSVREIPETIKINELIWEKELLSFGIIHLTEIQNSKQWQHFLHRRSSTPILTYT
jgi:hypothetical protein